MMTKAEFNALNILYQNYREAFFALPLYIQDRFWIYKRGRMNRSRYN